MPNTNVVTGNPRYEKISLKTIERNIRDYQSHLKHWKRLRHLYLTDRKRFYQERDGGALINSRKLRDLVKKVFIYLPKKP